MSVAAPLMIVTPLLLVVPFTLLPVAAQDMDRTSLPIREPKTPAITELDARNVKAPPKIKAKGEIRDQFSHVIDSVSLKGWFLASTVKSDSYTLLAMPINFCPEYRVESLGFWPVAQLTQPQLSSQLTRVRQANKKEILKKHFEV